MHRILVTAHSGLRWLVLVMLVALLVTAIRGWRSGAEAEKRDRMIKGMAIGFADLQLLLGLTLYFTGPWLRTMSEDMGHVMRTTQLRFFVIEHVTGMLVALALLHVGSVLQKRADDPTKGWKRLATCVGVALLLILASIPWPFMAYGRPWMSFG